MAIWCCTNNEFISNRGLSYEMLAGQNGENSLIVIKSLTILLFSFACLRVALDINHEITEFIYFITFFAIVTYAIKIFNAFYNISHFLLNSKAR